MKRFYLITWLIGVALMLWPAWGRHTLAAQQDGTLPPVVRLTVADLSVNPSNIVVGEPFALNFRVWNDNAIGLESLTITVRDHDNDAILVSSSGPKTFFIATPGQGLLTASSMMLTYAVGSTGVRQLDLVLEYSYILNGQLVPDTQIETLQVRVLEPTPTPTYTPTPTVTLTPTPSHTATATPTITPTATDNLIATEIAKTGALQATLAVQQATTSAQSETEVLQVRQTSEALATALTEVVAIATTQPNQSLPPTFTETPTATRSSDNSDQSESLPLESGSITTDGTENAVVVEFEAVPSPLTRGQLFTMILIVRNNSSVALSEIIVEWDQAGSAPAITPSGGTRWFVGALSAGASSTLIKRFYVTDQATPGVKRGRVLVTYRHGDRKWGDASEINLLVERDDPLWLRFLRALFSGLIP